MKKEEEYTLYKQHDENKITTNTFNKSLEKAGKILLVSNVDLAPEVQFFLCTKKEIRWKSIMTLTRVYWKQINFMYRITSLFLAIFSSHFYLFMVT